MSRASDNTGTSLSTLVGPQLGDAFGALLMECWEHGAEPYALSYKTMAQGEGDGTGSA